MDFNNHGDDPAIRRFLDANSGSQSCISSTQDGIKASERKMFLPPLLPLCVCTGHQGPSEAAVFCLTRPHSGCSGPCRHLELGMFLLWPLTGSDVMDTVPTEMVKSSLSEQTQHLKVAPTPIRPSASVDDVVPASRGRIDRLNSIMLTAKWRRLLRSNENRVMSRV